MQVVWHDDVRADQPSGGLLPRGTKGVVNFGSGQPRDSVFGFHGEEYKGRFKRVDVNAWAWVFAGGESIAHYEEV